LTYRYEKTSRLENSQGRDNGKIFKIVKHCIPTVWYLLHLTAIIIIIATMNADDSKTIIAGAAAWTAAVVPVQIVGRAVATGGTGTKILALVGGIGIAAGTTPLLAYIMNWKTQYACVRGIAIGIRYRSNH
jgi:hypothetical protein